MIQGQDILLDDADDISLSSGDIAIGATYVQEVGIITRLNQGELKSDPLLGPNLIRLINSKVSQQEVQTALKLHLERDGKNFEEAKEVIALNTKN